MNHLKRLVVLALFVLGTFAPAILAPTGTFALDEPSSPVPGARMSLVELRVTNTGISTHVMTLVPYATHPETGAVLYTAVPADNLIPYATHPETGTLLYIAGPPTANAGTVRIVAHNETDGVITVNLALLPIGVTANDFLAVEISSPAWAASAVVTEELELAPRETGSLDALLGAGEYIINTSGDSAIDSPTTSLTVVGG
jgi:hypothetical protein